MEENGKQQENHNHGKSMEHFWHVHESKSRPGWKYYYNTETKESIWIPCDPQVDKTKSKQNPTPSQPIMNKTNCPEAKGSPPIDASIEGDGSSMIHKNEVINNQLSNQNCNIPVCGNEQTVYKPINYINTVPLNVSAMPSYNSDVWSIPPATQLIVTPALTPFINQPQILLDQSQVLIPVSYNNLPQSIFTPAVRDIRNGSINIAHRNLPRFRPNPYKVNHGANRKYSMHRKFYPKRKNDLRRNLSSEEYYMHYNCDMYDYDEDEESVSHPQNICDDGRTYQNYQGVHKYLETSQRLDLTVIRDLATSDVNLDQWYIVADRIVIQENFNFLNNLIDSDNRCRIMVPQCVFTELRTLADAHNAVNVRRIFRFISKEIDSGRRWIGENFVNTVQNLSIFDVCLKLSSENYHVVLVSNDKECLKFKNTTKIPIFTMDELKNILTKSSPLNEPIKRKVFAERLVSVINNERRNSTEASSIFSSEHSFKNPQSSPLPKASNTDIQAKTVKENSHVESQNALDITNSSEEVQQVLCAQNSETDLANFNVDEPSTVHNTNTLIVNYNKRVIKLKQNDNNQKQCTNSKKGWSNRKRMSAGKNIELASTNNSVSTKQGTAEEQTIDGLIDVIGCKYNANSVNLLSDTSDCTDNGVSESCMPLKKKKNNLVSLRNDPDEPNTEVMFEITDKNMEEYLTMRSDEWVSRFVQIMEEVLSQVLHQEPPFRSEEFPAPWALQEAAQCVIKKFSNCFYVVDASNKLSIIIHKTSDVSGKISVNMEPTKFMKMYSYGVYLVKALMNVCNNCDDLYNAEESLKKLLHDIQSHDIDCPNDSFNNHLQAPPTVGKGSSPSLDDIEKPKSTIDEVSNRKSVERPIRCYKTTLHKSVVNLLEKNDDLETSFFSSLDLRKSSCSSLNNSIDVPAQAMVKAHEPDEAKNDSEVKNKPKIIRQFKKCMEYENRLKNRISKSIPLEVNYDSNDECSEDDYVDENLEAEDNILYRGEEYESENAVEMLEDNMKRFRCFIGLFVKDIREAFTQVHTLCKNIVASESTQFKSDNADTYKKAEKAHLYIDKLSKSLESILNREAKDPDKNIQTLMEKAGVHISFDKTLTTEYKSIISKCMDQAKEYLSYLNLVISLNKNTIV